MACSYCSPPTPAWPPPPAAPTPYAPAPVGMRPVSVPALAISPAPAVPVDPPETTSVQVLRRTLAVRRIERGEALESKEERERELAAFERRAEQLREWIAGQAAMVDVADGEISALLADIKALGGADEPAEA